MSNSRSARPMARGHRTPCHNRRSACEWIFRGAKSMMKHKWLKITIASTLMLSLGVMITPMFGLREMARPTAALAVQPQIIKSAAAAANAAQLAGDYSGAVKLQFTAAGVYSDTLATPPPPAAGAPEPPDLGAIDL